MRALSDAVVAAPCSPTCVRAACACASADRPRRDEQNAPRVVRLPPPRRVPRATPPSHPSSSRSSHSDERSRPPLALLRRPLSLPSSQPRLCRERPRATTGNAETRMKNEDYKRTTFDTHDSDHDSAPRGVIPTRLRPVHTPRSRRTPASLPSNTASSLATRCPRPLMGGGRPSDPTCAHTLDTSPASPKGEAGAAGPTVGARCIAPPSHQSDPPRVLPKAGALSHPRGRGVRRQSRP